jgi:hypothetical protein
MCSLSGAVANFRGHADVVILSFGYLILGQLLHLAILVLRSDRVNEGVRDRGHRDPAYATAGASGERVCRALGADSAP